MSKNNNEEFKEKVEASLSSHSLQITNLMNEIRNLKTNHDILSEKIQNLEKKLRKLESK